MGYEYTKDYTNNEKKFVRRSSKATALKLLCIAKKGYKCEICLKTYNLRSMHFHHTDPKNKSFEISRKINKLKDTKINKKSFDLLINEVDKCSLLCNNCHGRIHEFEMFNRDVLINAIRLLEELPEDIVDIKWDFEDVIKIYNDNLGEDYDEGDESGGSIGFIKRKLEPKCKKSGIPKQK